MHRLKEQGDLKRQAVQEAAGRLSLNNGLHNWTIAQLAEEAGLDLGAIYHYCKAKDDLKKHVLSLHTDQVNRIKEVSTQELSTIRLEIELELFRRG